MTAITFPTVTAAEARPGDSMGPCAGCGDWLTANRHGQPVDRHGEPLCHNRSWHHPSGGD